MPRIRTIKPDFWTDETITECSLSARLLFIGTWNFADDNGNIEHSVKQLKMKIFPSDEIKVGPPLNELLAHGLLIEYSLNGSKYLHIKGFKKHQVINRPSKTSIPEFNESLMTHGVLMDASLTEGKGRELEGKGKEKYMSGKTDDVPVSEIIEYLNLNAGKKYNPKSVACQKHIRARWSEGARIDQFRAAIDNQVRAWKGTEKEFYLRPATLFNSEKFDGYVNNTEINAGLVASSICSFPGCTGPGSQLTRSGQRFCRAHLPL